MQALFLLLAGFLTSIILGLIIIPRILVISHKKQLYDIPDKRKVHTIPVPRLGGLSFFPAIHISMSLILGASLYWSVDNFCQMDNQIMYELLFFYVGICLLYIVGVCDDLVGVGYRYKFIVQLLAALLLIASDNWFNSLGGLFGIYSIPMAIGVSFTIIVVVYIINAINLIDGIDGLASGLSCIALSVLGIIFYLQGYFIYSLLAFATLGILAPFWCYNVFGNANRGHKLFMGDAGSLTLGYVISFLIIRLCLLNESSPEAANPFLVVAFSTVLVPLLDVVRVVIHRLREHKNPFLPDKNHFHHKLLRTGMPSRWVLVTIIFVSMFFIVFNLFFAYRMDITLLFVLDVILWIGMHLIINRYLKFR